MLWPECGGQRRALLGLYSPSTYGSWGSNAILQNPLYFHVPSPRRKAPGDEPALFSAIVGSVEVTQGGKMDI